MTTSWKRTGHRAMDGHDPKCATFRALGDADVFLEMITQPFLGSDGIVPDSSNRVIA